MQAAKPASPSLRPQEGLGALHLFYRVDLAAWRDRSASDRAAALQELEELVDAARREPQTQVITLAMFARADLGFFILTPRPPFSQPARKEDHGFARPRRPRPRVHLSFLTEKSEYTRGRTSTPWNWRKRRGWPGAAPPRRKSSPPSANASGTTPTTGSTRCCPNGNISAFTR